MNTPYRLTIMYRLLMLTACIFTLTNCGNPSKEFEGKLAAVMRNYSNPDPRVAELALRRTIDLCEEYRHKSRDFDFDYYIGLAHVRLALLLEKQGKASQRKVHMAYAITAFSKSWSGSQFKTEKDALDFLNRLEVK